MHRFCEQILRDKTNGTFIEIRTHNPVRTLEADYDWNGIVIEHFVSGCKKYRSDIVHVITDATKLDYVRLFDETEMPENIDYLSLELDVDATIKTLHKLDVEVLHRHKFAIVTFEHIGVEKEPREVFKRRGYVCVSEDCYVHPDLVDLEYVYK